MLHVKRLSSGLSAALLGLSSLMTFGFNGVAHAAGNNTCTWTGATNTTFSTASNWTGCNNVAPQSGDIIAFTVLGTNSQTYTLNNDLSVNLGGVTYGSSSMGTTNSTGYTLSKLHLADGAVVTSIPAQGSQYSNVHVNTGNDYTVAGDLTLNGGIGSSNGNAATLTPHNLVISAAAGFLNYAGGMQFHQYNPTGSVTIGDGAGYVGVGGESSITIQKGGTFFPYAGQSATTYSVPVTYGGGTGLVDPIVETYTGSIELTGAQTLNNNVTAYPSSNNTLTFSGPISGNYAITKSTDSYATGTLVINSSSNGSATANGTQATPATTTTVSDSQPSVFLDVPNQSTTILDGARGEVSVEAGGLLKGTGTATRLFVNKDGIVAPGHSPGKLTVSAQLQLSGTYQAELKNSTDGGYDQLQVGVANDTDNTQPDVSLGSFNQDGTQADTPILAVSLYDGYSIKAGDKFTIINNLSKTDVKGMFNGLPEGATFKVGTAVFSITYKGGDGNDVVLTAISAPTTPDTGFAMVSAHPGVTLGLAAVAAGAILVIARRSRFSLVPVRVRSSSRRSTRR